ncbi:MAG: 4-hydroxy-tetrahydrodipicolinate reductase [Bacteroidota bacterium]|nr:4-hydroxy-tetrahydrodipicolinate reductase [Bacteroidota bacterium]
MREENEPISLAIIGYGKMGREIRAAAEERGMHIVSIIDPAQEGCTPAITDESIGDADVCLEFTTPAAVVGNIRTCARVGKNVVVGTTGWYHELAEVERIVAETGTAVLYASNFSIGVHIFTRLVELAARLFCFHPVYDVAVHECHHAAKKDAPSGTAYRIAEAIMRNDPRKTRLRVDTPSQGVAEGELSVSSSRVGFVPGTHIVMFDGPADTVELIHRARNRRPFADGALMAASWIRNRKGLFTMEDMLNDIESVHGLGHGTDHAVSSGR